jgi:hypothetical protein
VWSVWSERVSVYLGTTVALVQRPGAPLVSLSHSPTLPLADVLTQLDEATRRSAGGKPWRQQVALSASLCPPVAFAVPKGLKRWDEQQALARASAAHQLGLPTGDAAQLVCTLDPSHSGLAAALHSGTHQQLLTWAQRFGGRLAGLQPLWAIATQAQACRAAQVQGLTLQEPDAFTVLRLAPGATPQAETALGEVSANAAGDLTLAHWRFTAKPLKAPRVAPDGPTAWAAHWERSA